MSAVPETLPALAERADAAYLDFVEGFREYILGKGADFEDRLNTALLTEQARRGQPWDDVEQIREYVHSLPLGRLRDRLSRTQQEMKWFALRRSFESHLNWCHGSLRPLECLPRLCWMALRRPTRRARP